MRILLGLLFLLPAFSMCLAQTETVPNWQKCGGDSSIDAGADCTAAGRLAGRALSDAYTLHGVRQIFLNSPEDNRDRWALSSALSAPDFEEAIGVAPENSWAWMCRGMARRLRNDLDGTIDDLTEALRLDPGYEEALTGRGEAYTARHQYDRALSDFESALKINPGKASVFALRGDIFLALRSVSRASADYNSAIKLQPDDPEWYERRARALRTRGPGRGARADMRIAAFLRGRRNISMEWLHRDAIREATRQDLDRWEAGELSLKQVTEELGERATLLRACAVNALGADPDGRYR